MVPYDRETTEQWAVFIFHGVVSLGTQPCQPWLKLYAHPCALQDLSQCLFDRLLLDRRICLDALRRFHRCGLRRIDLSAILAVITDDYVDNIAAAGSSCLDDLRVSNSDLTSAGLGRLLAGEANLNTLHLGRCNKLTADCLEPVAGAFLFRYKTSTHASARMRVLCLLPRVHLNSILGATPPLFTARSSPKGIVLGACWPP